MESHDDESTGALSNRIQPTRLLSMKIPPFARRAPWHRLRTIIPVLALLGAGVVAPTQAED